MNLYNIEYDDQEVVEMKVKYPNSIFLDDRYDGALMGVDPTNGSVICFFDELWNSPSPEEHVKGMSPIDLPKYVTIEPVMDFDTASLLEMVKRCNPVQVNIGGDSGGHKLPEPSKQKLYDLIDGLKEFTTIDKKKNLKRLLKD